MPKEAGPGSPTHSRHDPFGIGPGKYPRPEVPRLSLAERERRWKRVRALMARDKLDAIITVANSSYWDQANANGRYLTSVGGNCTPISAVFPLEGTVTAITGPAPTPDFWLQYQDWVDDIRPTPFNIPSIVERIRELGLEGGRIGIAGLEGVARAPEGLITHVAYRMLTEQLPQAQFLNATFLMEEVRFVKSDEEVSMLAEGVRIVEKVLDVLDREARPGVAECVVFGRMAGALIEHGSEPTTFMVWSSGNPQPPVASTVPSRRPIGADDIIQVEVEAKYCGYLAHCAATISAGKPDSTLLAMAKLQYEAVQRCLDAMRPGVPIDVLVGICAEVAAGTPYQCKPVMHSRGHGQDAPVLTFQSRKDRMAGWKLEENSVFEVKPLVSTADGTRKFMWGDTVVVTPGGAKRLGTRAAPLVG